MKKLFSLIITASLICFYSCGGGGTAVSDEQTVKSEEIDYMMLSNPEGLKKVYDMVVAKLDTNIRHVDKIDMSVNYPKTDSDDGNTSLSLTVVQLNNTNKNKLTQYRYFSSQGKWNSGETMTVDLIGGDAENFVLADNMMDLSGLTFEKLNKVVQEAFAKYKDDEKFNYQYVSTITIGELMSDREPMVRIFMKGQLKSNELMKDESERLTLRKVLQ